MNIGELVNIQELKKQILSDVQFVIKENLEYQIKELIKDFEYPIDAVEFANKGLVEYYSRYCAEEHSIAFLLKRMRGKESLLNYLEGHGMSLLDFSKAYAEYCDEKDFVVVFPESREFRFFDTNEITDYLEELVPILVDVAYEDLFGNSLEE